MDTNTFKSPTQSGWRAAWLAPCHAGHPMWRALALAFAAAFFALTALMLAIGQPSTLRQALPTFGMAVACAWIGMLASLALLALDARRLCLPGMHRLAERSLLLYAGLTLLLACALFLPFGLPLAPVLLATALAMTISLCVVLAPLELQVLFLGLVAALALHDVLGLPAWQDPRWMIWGGITLLALLPLAAWCWRRVVRGRYQRTLLWQVSARGFTFDSEALFETATGATSKRALREAGPQHPRLALRIGLGGLYLPHNAIACLRGAADVVAGLLFIPIMMAVLPHGALHHLRGNGASLQPLWLLGTGLLQLASLLVLAYAYATLRRCWSRPQAELPLLRLLPALDSRNGVTHAGLCRVTLGLPLVWWALTLLGQALTAHAAGLAGGGLWLALSPSLVGAVLFVALSLRLLAGRRLLMAGEVLPVTLYAILALFSSLIALTLPLMRKLPFFDAMEGGLLALWLAGALVMLAAAARYWRSCRRRPHPFLPVA